MQIVLAESTDPLYRQICEQIQAARDRGELGPGDRLPAIRELAAELGVNRNTVAHAYRLLRRSGVIAGRPGRGMRVIAAGGAGQDEGERLWQRLEPALRGALAGGMPEPLIEALVEQTLRHWQPLVRRSAEAGAGTVVRCLGSHDFCLDLLARHLRAADTGLRFVWGIPIGSTAGVLAVGHNEADLAGVHLLDPATGDYNRAVVDRLLPETPIRLVTLAYREQGLIVRRGNPLRLSAIDDLVGTEARFANRQPGSGTRALLDHLLARHNLAPTQINPTRELTTHLAVAAAVAGGAADAGLGVRAAARALDLDFVPLATERYDLAFRQADEDAPWLATLLEVLASPAFRTDVEALEGYDASRTAWLN